MSEQTVEDWRLEVSTAEKMGWQGASPVWKQMVEGEQIFFLTDFHKEMSGKASTVEDNPPPSTLATCHTCCSKELWLD